MIALAALHKIDKPLGGVFGFCGGLLALHGPTPLFLAQ